MAQQGTVPGKDTKMSTLKQHINTMVRDLIPLGVPRSVSVDDRKSFHSRPGVLSQKASLKAGQSCRSANPLPKQAMENSEMKMKEFSVLLRKVHIPTSSTLSMAQAALPKPGVACKERGHQERSRSRGGAAPDCNAQVPAGMRRHSLCSGLVSRSSVTLHSPEKRPLQQNLDSQTRQGGGYTKQSQRPNLPVNPTVGGGAAMCHPSSVKRKAEPVVEGVWQAKQACSGSLGSDIRPAEDRGLKKQEKSTGSKVLPPSKRHGPLCSQEAQEPGLHITERMLVTSKTLTQGVSQAHIQAFKPDPRELESNVSEDKPAGDPSADTGGCQPTVPGADGCQKLAPPMTPPPSQCDALGGDSVPDRSQKAKPDSPVETKNHNNAKSASDMGSRATKKAQDMWDPLELDFGLSLGSCRISSSSSESEDEPLVSLQEILQRSAHPPSTPQAQRLPLPVRISQPVTYQNTLEQMLKEKEQNRRLKDVETKLLLSCEEDLQKLAEEEENKELAEEAMPQEHREFQQKFSVVSSTIPELHPGEEVFILANFGRLYSLQTLDFRRCAVTPQNMAQKTLLQASMQQLPLLVSAGLLRKAYRAAPCPPAVSLLLFQMMSIHPVRKTSTQILRALEDIALISADHIVVNQNAAFEVWTPSLKEVVLVFLNMGVPFVTLFPLQSLQPPFFEGDILQSMQIQTEQVQDTKPVTFPRHNLENVIKYLALSTALASKAYSDEVLLLLLTAICKLGLETRLQLMATEDLSSLLEQLLDNSSDWNCQMPRICLALADLSEDHHNLRRLVQLLPHSKRGKQLRKHVSVCMISKLLGHSCTYIPTNTDFQLGELRPFISRMRPSLLLRSLFPTKGGQEDSAATQDQQVYYLCYSLLALINEASNFESCPLDQKSHLKMLCAELEKHIKCDIRESEKCLYRSKVKDFVARIYTRWQVLLQKSRPTEGQLYDYWQPLPEDAGSDSQQNHLAPEDKVEVVEAGEAENAPEDEDDSADGLSHCSS